MIPEPLKPCPSPPAERTADRISLVGLLLLFLKIGSIGFGGGMATIALMERELVRKRGLLGVEEFVHGIGLGQVLGSFAVNAAFFVGYRLYGWVGGLLSASAFLLPSIVLVTALSHLYFRYHSIPALQGAVAGLGPVVIALILVAGWSLGRRVVRSRAAALIAAAALAAGAARINPVWVLLAAGAAGFLLVPRRARAALPKNQSVRNIAIGAIPAALGPLPALGTLAFTFLKIGFVFFGGGFALIPVLHDRLVGGLGWLNAREFVDGVAISNLTPGPIAVLATFAGYRLAGVAGALVATAALFAPAMLLMLFLSTQYERYRDDDRAQRFLGGVNPAVTGLVFSAALLLGRSAMNSWRGFLFAAVSLLLLGRLRWPPAVVLALGAAAGFTGLLA